MYRLVFWTIAALLTCGTGLASEKKTPQLGSVHFENSGSEAAQAAFHRGLAALHSFFYDEAADYFREAQKIDPDFAMAYWGEAMTHNHPLWDQQNRKAARKIIDDFLPNEAAWTEKIPTQRERDWFQLLNVLYGEGAKRPRDLAYLEALGKLVDKYPDDFEAKAFHALAYLGVSEPSEPQFERNCMRAAAICERLVDENPEHPGVVHYLIHAYDDPIHAPLGLQYARTYAKVAPSAHHALHMPSHIFVQLGMWDDVIAANKRAWAASKDWVKKRNHDVSKQDYHSLSWLHYGFLQEGRLKEARDTIDKVWAANQRVDAYRIRSSWQMMKARQVLTEAAWEDPELTMDVAKRAGYSRGPVTFALGMSAIKSGRFDLAAECIDMLEAKSKDDEGTVRGAERATTAGIMYKMLEGVLALEMGQNDAAVDHLQAAVKRELATPAPRGPVSPIKPALEVYGDALRQLNRPTDAIPQYEQSLLRTPNRPDSLFGLAQALDAADRRDEAIDIYRRLADIWSQADAAYQPADMVKKRLATANNSDNSPSDE